MLLFSVQAITIAIAASPQVVLRIETSARKDLASLGDLQKQLNPATLKIYNPAYKREMTYQGFWLEEVLALKHFPKETDIVFLCRDGFTALLPAGSVKTHQWLLAYNEASGQWTPLIHGSEKVSPAPWYLVGTDRKSFATFSWPYQVVALKPIKSW